MQGQTALQDGFEGLDTTENACAPCASSNAAARKCRNPAEKRGVRRPGVCAPSFAHLAHLRLKLAHLEFGTRVVALLRNARRARVRNGGPAGLRLIVGSYARARDASESDRTVERPAERGRLGRVSRRLRAVPGATGPAAGGPRAARGRCHATTLAGSGPFGRRLARRRESRLFPPLARARGPQRGDQVHVARTTGGLWPGRDRFSGATRA